MSKCALFEFYPKFSDSGGQTLLDEAAIAEKTKPITNLA